MHLQIDNLCWSAGDKTILNNINLAIPKGSFVGLLGPNGSGKSSLLRCAYRRYKPNQGQVLLNGKDITKMSAKRFARQVAVVLQEFPAEFGFTIAEVVAMGLTPHQTIFSRQSNKDSVNQVLEMVGLDHLAKQSFDLLSGGEKQRCLLARALMQQPELLILDEPTNHLDIHYQFGLLDLVSSLGISVLATLHDLNIAARYCDKIYLMDDGNIVSKGSPHQVLTAENMEQTFAMSVVVDRQVNNPVPRINYLKPIKEECR